MVRRQRTSRVRGRDGFAVARRMSSSALQHEGLEGSCFRLASADAHGLVL